MRSVKQMLLGVLIIQFAIGLVFVTGNGFGIVLLMLLGLLVGILGFAHRTDE